MLSDGAPARLGDRAGGSGPIAQDLFWILPWRSWAALRTGGAAQISGSAKSLDCQALTTAQPTVIRRDCTSYRWLSVLTPIDVMLFGSTSRELNSSLLGAIVGLRKLRANGRGRDGQGARQIEEDAAANAILSNASEKVPKAKVEGFTNIQLLLLILTWLVAISVPFAVTQLPESAQVVAANEIAAAGVALVIADKIRKQG